MTIRPVVALSLLASAFAVTGSIAAESAASVASHPEPPAPADLLPSAGPLKLVAATALGGPGDDEVVGVAIAPDYSVVVAGDCVDLKPANAAVTLLGPPGTLAAAPPDDGKKKDQRHPSTHGFIARLSSDGRTLLGVTQFGYGQATIARLQLDPRGDLVITGENLAGADLGGGAAGQKGPFIAKLSADAKHVQWVLYHDQISDAVLDGNGDLLVLAGAKLIRYATDTGKELWNVGWSAHGSNRPGALAVAPQSGIATVVGYGMTATGHEPYKDPYAHAFARDGKPLWSLWNPDPKLECDAKFGGNGLMADTTGHAAGATLDGKLLLMLYADGGNTVCMRDPADPSKPLDKAVLAGVHQAGAGFGFKGASKTSVIFRVDATTGTIEKGTWMSAWMTPQHANSLSIDAASGDAQGNLFLAGNSASGCPLKEPWYPSIPGTYLGGGFLAMFDRDFKLQQCGYLAHSHLGCVAARGDVVVVGGSVKDDDAASDGAKDPVKLYKPVQAALGGGRDGYVAVFRRAAAEAR